MACQNRTEHDVVRISAAFDAIATSTGNLEAFAEADVGFHTALAAATHNPLTEIVASGIANVVLSSSQSGLRVVETKQEWEEAVEHHRDIALGVTNRDINATRNALSRHFDAAEQRLRRIAMSEEPNR